MKREVSKVVCACCGVDILQSTAAKNGNVCAPCKTTRPDLATLLTTEWAAAPAARARTVAAPAPATQQRRKQQRDRENNNPLLRLWRELVERAQITGHTLAGFTEAERQYYAVGVLEDEIYGGGFDQYFFNVSGNYYPLALEGLEAMGATETHVLLQRAKHVLFDFGEVPPVKETRRAVMIRRASDSRFHRLQRLDSLYCADPDGLAARTGRFALKHKLIRRI